MGEGTAVAKVTSLTGGIFSPGIDILKSWQGIVEISLRAAVVILSLITIIAGAACQSANSLRDQTLPFAETDSAAGWLIFVGVLGLIYEVVVILQRFLNLNIINNHALIFIIVDAIVNGVMILSLFAGAVALASYVPNWRDSDFLGSVPRIIAASEATAVFAFALIIVLIALTVFILLGALVFKWNPTLGKYSPSSSGGGGGGGEA